MLQTMFGPCARLLSLRPLWGLRKSLLALPKDLLEPLRLQIVDGHSLREIAERLEISEEEATYRVRCARDSIYGVAID